MSNIINIVNDDFLLHVIIALALFCGEPDIIDCIIQLLIKITNNI